MATEKERERFCFGTDNTWHTARCYCGKPAKWHVMYGSGCGHVCGIHRRSIIRKKGSVTSSPLT